MATKALGSENLKAYFLPSIYSQKISFEIVESLGKNLKLNVQQKDITKILKLFLKEFFNNQLNSLSQQNLQARLRMLFLMAQANQNQALLLGTGNKSELALGYSTLYGDLSGGFMSYWGFIKNRSL